MLLQHSVFESVALMKVMTARLKCPGFSEYIRMTRFGDDRPKSTGTLNRCRGSRMLATVNIHPTVA
jgi:hypothetical protein